MAVYYKWIKGCSEGSTLTNGLWSYIKWGSGDASTNTNNLPTLWTDIGKSDSGQENDLGYFLTNKATNIKIETGWTFESFICLSNKNDIGAKLIWGSDIGVPGGPKGLNFITSTSNSPIGTNPFRFLSPVIAKSTLEVGGKLTGGEGLFSTNLNVGGYTEPLPESSLGVQGAIKSNDSVHAPYFNATSDMRAKENIKKLPFSALSFINNLSVYQFNYKGKNDTIPGVLAQDVLNSQPEGLSLVDNIDASGENGDYMSIKEDKFVFLLMRAVQELKEDNDALRYEIEQLKQKLK